jgi:hypothetical protein
MVEEKLRYQFFIIREDFQAVLPGHVYTMKDLVSWSPDRTWLKSTQIARILSDQVIHDYARGTDIGRNLVCVLSGWIKIWGHLRLFVYNFEVLWFKLILLVLWNTSYWFAQVTQALRQRKFVYFIVLNYPGENWVLAQVFETSIAIVI